MSVPIFITSKDEHNRDLISILFSKIDFAGDKDLKAIDELRG